MQIRRKFGHRKRTKPTKGLLLVFLLVIVVILWFRADQIMEALF